MRALFLVLIVASNSPALATKPAIPVAPADSSVVDYPTTPATGIAPGAVMPSDPPRPATDWDQPLAQTPDDDRAPRVKTRICITANSIIISYGEGDRIVAVAPGANATIICDSFHAESAPAEKPKLQCQNCDVSLPNGAKGRAAEVVYDLAAKKLTLSGSKDQPVKLARDGGGVVQSLSTSTIELELNFSAQPAFLTPTPAYAPSATYAPTPSQPLANDPPRSIVAPQPMER